MVYNDIMLLTKREEQLLKAFLNYGKLSIDNMGDILKVSRRTVYRVLNELTGSLESLNISIIKEDQKYYLTGELEELRAFSSQDNFSKNERLNLITYYLLIANQEITNEFLQEKLAVSNVTIIQDIAIVEKRLADFNILLKRQKGYQVTDSQKQKRWLLAVLLSNNQSISDFWKLKTGYFDLIPLDRMRAARDTFQKYQSDIPEMDSKLMQFFSILLALSNWQEIESSSHQVSKLALDFSQKVYGEFSKETKSLYSIQEILYFARLLDQFVLKRQETPLFQENFDSEFYYNVSNLIDKVALYTKINFTKDKTLFKFLFNHIRLSLAVPIIFADSNISDLAHEALHHNDYLHRLIRLLVIEIFPTYLQSESEFELMTLHFASSLRRSPTIYPIRLLLLTDERPLATELLMSRLKQIAPFVEFIQTKGSTQLDEEDFERYDAVLSTKLFANDKVHLVSTFPTPNELIELEQWLQNIQINRDIKRREDSTFFQPPIFKDYFNASQLILNHFSLTSLKNDISFEQTVVELIRGLEDVTDYPYLSQKLLNRFKESPMAIPETGLALLHTQSSKVQKSSFKVVELENPVIATSMNGQDEEVKRILVMLTRLEEDEEIRDLMTAISQSIIENHLYTEIYKTGNYDIIYQLLNQIFTEKIKHLEN